VVSGGVAGKPPTNPAPRSDQPPQKPLSDDELDAYFKKSSGQDNGQVIDQPGRDDG
jgi:hypothetical protein